MEPIIEAWIFPYERSLREQRWMSGALYEDWKARFGDELPLFFDAAADWFVEHQGTTEVMGSTKRWRASCFTKRPGICP